MTLDIKTDIDDEDERLDWFALSLLVVAILALVGVCVWLAGCSCATPCPAAPAASTYAWPAPFRGDATYAGWPAPFRGVEPYPASSCAK